MLGCPKCADGEWIAKFHRRRKALERVGFVSAQVAALAILGLGMTLAVAGTMQGTGWLSITSLGSELPYWLDLWFGVYPTWETLGAQLASAVFVIGSFFLAKELKVKRPQRRARVAGAGGRPHSVAPISDRVHP